MYKPEPPSGWRTLDDYHSPGDTVRYVRERGDGWFDVVDVYGYGRPGTYSVVASVERGLFENTGGHDRPYHDTEVQGRERLAEDTTEEDAFSVAMDRMRGSSGGMFDRLF